MKTAPHVIGNWKMHKTGREAADFFETFIPLVEKSEANIYVAVPFTALHSSVLAARHTKIVIGAQNMHESREGALTGEISALMLKESGAAFVLLGHSERRSLFGETDETIRKKVLRALLDDLVPILCVGETLQENQEGRTKEVLKRQLDRALYGLSADQAAKILIAYEPVWAIGTGKAASPQAAEEAHQSIKTILSGLFGNSQGLQIPILYGGSVKPETTVSLCAMKSIDGLLVGGASLDPHIFASIVNHSNEKNT